MITRKNSSSYKKEVSKKLSDFTKIILCPKCGFKISGYFFTKVKDLSGKVRHSKCPNCGYFEDPE